MDLSKSIINTLGISLGGIELATEFLYGETEMFEPELTEVKMVVSNKENISKYKRISREEDKTLDDIMAAFEVEMQADGVSEVVKEELGTDIWSTESNAGEIDISNIIKSKSNETEGVHIEYEIDDDEDSEEMEVSTDEEMAYYEREVEDEEDYYCDDIENEDKSIDSKVEVREVKEDTISETQRVDIDELRIKKEAEEAREIVRKQKELDIARNKIANRAKQNNIKVNSEEVRRKTSTVENKGKYDAMSEESLYRYVKKYMIQIGVSAGVINIEVLYSKFGAVNINKLLRKGYLIKIGKGVTAGL